MRYPSKRRPGHLDVTRRFRLHFDLRRVVDAVEEPAQRDPQRELYDLCFGETAA